MWVVQTTVEVLEGLLAYAGQRGVLHQPLCHRNSLSCVRAGCERNCPRRNEIGIEAGQSHNNAKGLRLGTPHSLLHMPLAIHTSFVANDPLESLC